MRRSEPPLDVEELRVHQDVLQRPHHLVELALLGQGAKDAK
jgi:hypothetical protein